MLVSMIVWQNEQEGWDVRVKLAPLNTTGATVSSMYTISVHVGML